MRQLIKKDLLAFLRESFGIELPEIPLEHPAITAFGDYSTNISLTDFPLLFDSVSCHSKMAIDKNPLALAEGLKGAISDDRKGGRRFQYLREIKVEKPGFINFYLDDLWLANWLAVINQSGEVFGSPAADVAKQRSKKKVQVECVSANPTGPLHVGNIRGGPLGDTIANVLKKNGYLVWREYYHNDVGGQVKKLGESILHWYKKEYGVTPELPEDGYQGDYVRDLAKEVAKNFGRQYLEGEPDKAADVLGAIAVEKYLQTALSLCRELGIIFDLVVKESALVTQGKTGKALDTLRQKGTLKEDGGAWWFAPSDDFLADRECVVIRSDGNYTYFANDIGYHLDKFGRGFETVIDVWGANHHGHVPRMKAAMRALGLDPDKLKVILYQWVRVRRGGELVSMSKRKGTFVLAEDVLREVGKDAFRFFFLLKDSSTPLDFDLELMTRQSNDNPVYYVQYAHARMSNILKNYAGDLASIRQMPSFRRLTESAELNLIRHLLKFPELVEDVGQSLAVHQLTTYAIELADLFHHFYEECRVLGSDLEKERLGLVLASKIVLKNDLDLLGVSAPERM